jgi:hypothetical protein
VDDYEDFCKFCGHEFTKEYDYKEENKQNSFKNSLIKYQLVRSYISLFFLFPIGIILLFTLYKQIKELSGEMIKC